MQTLDVVQPIGDRHAKKNYTNRRYLDALNQKVLVFDGAMGTNLQRMNLTPKISAASSITVATTTWSFPAPKRSKKSIVSFLEVAWM